MILWIILFLLIIAISLILAYLSMRDYQEIPQKSPVEYGLFLIRQTDQFNPGILNSIREYMIQQSLIISIERLFKGKQTALTIFGPKKILAQFTSQLNLLELEDYVQNLVNEDIFIGEVGAKDTTKAKLSYASNMFRALPILDNEDQFFWQIILNARKHDLSFQTQIRILVCSKDPLRKQALAASFQDLSEELIKIPQPYSQEQMMDFYRERSLSKDSKGPILTSEAVTNLLKIT